MILLYNVDPGLELFLGMEPETTPINVCITSLDVHTIQITTCPKWQRSFSSASKLLSVFLYVYISDAIS